MSFTHGPWKSDQKGQKGSTAAKNLEPRRLEPYVDTYPAEDTFQVHSFNVIVYK